MQTCEKCGTPLKALAPATEGGPVRYACPKCAAERRAQRAASTTPPPAAAPAAPSASASATRARPAATPTPTPTQRPAAAPRAESPAPRASAASERLRKADSAAQEAARPRSSLVMTETAALRREEGKVMKIVWISTLVLGLITAGVVFKVISQKKTEREQREAALKASQDFFAAVKSFDTQKSVDAERAVKFIEEKTALWKGTELEADVLMVKSKALKTQDDDKQKGELNDRLTNVERELRDVATLKSADFAEVRRRIEALELKGGTVGPEFVERVRTAKTTADREYLNKLHAELQASAAAAAASPDGLRTALIAYGQAEDELLKLFEKAFQNKDKTATDFIEKHYREVIAESDVVCEKLFTPQEIERTPWKDMLGPDQAANWNASQVKGFQQRIENGVLYFIGPDVGANAKAVASIGDRERLRDFVVEMEFTLLKGKYELYLRAGKRIDNTVEFLSIDSQSFAPDVPHKIQISFIGSHRVFTDLDQKRELPADIPWTKSRRGGIAFAIPEGTELRISRLRVRQLR